MTERRGAVRHALSVARVDLLDLARVRSTWFALLLFPVINVLLIVLLPGVLTQREQARQEVTRYRVAAEGTAEDVAAVTSALDSAGLRFDAVADARRAVLDRAAEVGLVVPGGAAGALSGEGQVQLKAYVLGTRNESRLAIGRVVSEVESARTAISIDRVESRSLPENVVLPLIPTGIDLADTERGGRLDLAGIIPLLLLLPLSGTIGMAGQRISGAKDQRVLEPLLLLPIPRRVLLAGKAMAGFALGGVTVPAVAAPLALGRVMPIGSTGQRVSVPVTTLLGIVGVSVALLVLLVALGMCAGSASRTSAELGSILPFVSFPVILLALSLQFFADISSEPMLLVVPALGPVLVARDLVAGVAEGRDTLIAVVASLAWAAVLLVGAARLLDRDAVVRPTAA